MLAKISELATAQADELRKKRSLVIDKEGLVDLCKEYIEESNIDTLLKCENIKTSPNATPPESSGSQMAAEAMEFSNSSPEQLLYRAECMRKQPDIVRASDPAMANLSNEEIYAMADRMKMLAENPAVSVILVKRFNHMI